MARICKVLIVENDDDVRDLLGGLFAKMWGLSPADMDRVFPGSTPRDLGLI